MIVTRVNADRPPRTRVGHFNQPARFPPKRPRLLNRKGKHKLIRENSKSIRSTYLSTIGHFVKLVFTNLRLFACREICQRQTPKENTADIKQLKKPCVRRNNDLHLIQQLATYPDHLRMSCPYSTPNLKGKYGSYKTIEKALRAEKWWPTLDKTACNASGPFANVMSVLLIPGTGHAYKKLECTLLGQSVRSFDLPRGSARELAESARNFCSTFGRPHALQVRTNSWLDFLIWSVPHFFFIGSFTEFYSCLNLHCTITDCSLYWVGLSFKHENDFCFPKLDFTACGAFHNDKTFRFDAWSPLP